MQPLLLLSKIGVVADITGRVIAPLTIVMMILTVVVVIARYLFNVGSIPVQETVVYMHAMVFMLGIPYTLRQEGHVRVDLVYQRLSARSQACVNLAGTWLFLVPLAVFIFYAAWTYVGLAWQLKEGSAEPGGLPIVYLLKTLIPVFAVCLLLEAIAQTGRLAREILNG